MIERARERDIDLEMERKKKPNEAHLSGGLGKRPKGVDARGKGR